MKQILIALAIFLQGCCAKCPGYSQIIMLPTQQERRIQALQEQVLEKELAGPQEMVIIKSELKPGSDEWYIGEREDGSVGPMKRGEE